MEMALERAVSHIKVTHPPIIPDLLPTWDTCICVPWYGEVAPTCSRVCSWSLLHWKGESCLAKFCLLNPVIRKILTPS